MGYTVSIGSIEGLAMELVASVTVKGLSKRGRQRRCKTESVSTSSLGVRRSKRAGVKRRQVGANIADEFVGP